MFKRKNEPPKNAKKTPESFTDSSLFTKRSVKQKVGTVLTVTAASGFFVALFVGSPVPSTVNARDGVATTPTLSALLAGCGRTTTVTNPKFVSVDPADGYPRNMYDYPFAGYYDTGAGEGVAESVEAGKVFPAGLNYPGIVSALKDERVDAFVLYRDSLDASTVQRLNELPAEYRTSNIDVGVAVWDTQKMRKQLPARYDIVFVSNGKWQGCQLLYKPVFKEFLNSPVTVPAK